MTLPLSSEYTFTDDTSLPPIPFHPDADLADAIAACPTYLAPLNSIGAGGVCFSALESFEWMPLESAADLRAVIARLRAAPAQNDEFVAAMRAGLASGHVASAPMMRRVDAILARHAAIRSGFCQWSDGGSGGRQK